MSDARDDIAFIRQAVADGRAFAFGRSPDILIWGIALAIGFFANYAALEYRPGLSIGWIWVLTLILPWAFTLRRVASRAPHRLRPPMVQAVSAVWIGSGIFLTTLTVAANWGDALREGWMNAVVAGAFGFCFFATASLLKLGWMRIVAIGWWIGEIALFAIRHRADACLFSGALMLLLLAGPGLYILVRGARTAP
jgi:hypothetical protein